MTDNQKKPSQQKGPAPAHQANKLAYTITLADAVVILDGATPVNLSIRMMVGEPVTLFIPTPDVVNIGVRYFQLLPQDGGSKGELLFDTRPIKREVVLEAGKTSEFSFLVPANELPEEFIIEIDLVAEGKYWFSDIGHRALVLPVRQRSTILSSPDNPVHSLADLAEINRSFSKREARYDAIVFALLHELRKGKST